MGAKKLMALSIARFDPGLADIGRSLAGAIANWAELRFLYLDLDVQHNNMASENNGTRADLFKAIAGSFPASLRKLSIGTDPSLRFLKSLGKTNTETLSISFVPSNSPTNPTERFPPVFQALPDSLRSPYPCTRPLSPSTSPSCVVTRLGIGRLLDGGALTPGLRTLVPSRLIKDLIGPNTWQSENKGLESSFLCSNATSDGFSESRSD